MIKIPSLKTMLGVGIVVLGLSLMTGSIKLQSIEPSSSFESEPVTLSGFELQDSQDTNPPQMIIIPSLDIFLEVKKAKLINGYWEVFEDTAGWGEGSGVPGQLGNQVIFAHAREGLFAPLKDIERGMNIIILTDNVWYEYKVNTIDEVYPGNTTYIEQSEKEELTLYTCSGYQDSKRLIVRAERL